MVYKIKCRCIFKIKGNLYQLPHYISEVGNRACSTKSVSSRLPIEIIYNINKIITAILTVFKFLISKLVATKIKKILNKIRLNFF